MSTTATKPEVTTGARVVNAYFRASIATVARLIDECNAGPSAAEGTAKRLFNKLRLLLNKLPPRCEIDTLLSHTAACEQSFLSGEFKAARYQLAHFVVARLKTLRDEAIK